MHLGMLLQMSVDGLGDRIAVGSADDGLSFADLGERAGRAGTVLAREPGEHVVLVDENSLAVPLALFGAAVCGKSYVPLNYRLADDRLRAIVERLLPATLVAGDGVADRLGPMEGLTVVSRKELLDSTRDKSIPVQDDPACEPDGIAVLLFTSGTTGEPKAAVLRHRNLAAYIIGSLEFAGAAEDEATVVSVPPYHIASVSSVLSSTYLGRRVVQLERFEPKAWVHTVRAEQVTHCMVVPTMLGRILDVLESDGLGLPSLRALAYGGGPMPLPVVERAIELLDGVDLTNAYGLTETSSTIAVLGPEDHREAFAGDATGIRARLGSVGRALPGIELSIRDVDGQPVAAGQTGEVWVRGEQVSGEYLGSAPQADDGWFRTRDAGRVDDDGFLFVDGRLDDVIVRGGENLSPGEIEATLRSHPSVESAAVVGVPDVEWGERVVAAVVLTPDGSATESELRSHVRAALRSARTPERIVFRSELPYNETGKLLRRELRAYFVD